MLILQISNEFLLLLWMIYGVKACSTNFNTLKLWKVVSVRKKLQSSERIAKESSQGYFSSSWASSSLGKGSSFLLCSLLHYHALGNFRTVLGLIEKL